MRTLILSSSQSKHPVGADPWVRATLDAVDEAALLGHEIVASVGLPSWEIALWRAARRKATIHLVCPLREGTDLVRLGGEVVRSFALCEERVRWHWVRKAGRSHKAAWGLRDRVAVALAQQVWVISLRRGGRLSRLLDHRAATRRDHHAVAFERGGRPRRWEKRAPSCSPNVWPPGSLIHLTRSSDGPWPGELACDYYGDVVTSGTRYARSAFETLCRIVREGRIRGSSFRSRSGARRVCLSACTPEEAMGLVRFRARYARYAFEPYGLVISERAAREAGASPVTYASEPSGDPFEQGPGRGGHWKREREWRVLGDLDLRALHPGEVRVVTATASEADALATWSPYEVTSFGYAEGELSEKIVRSGASFPGLVAS